MSLPEILPVNFAISADAKEAAEKARVAFDTAHPADPAAVLCVAWAVVIPDDGPRSENVVIGYYQKSMLADVAHGIQETSGVKLVFFTTPEFHGNFEGRVLDFIEERGFFLREP